MIPMTKAECADRYTILQLKHKAGLDVGDEMKKLEKEVFNVPLGELERVNAKMWRLEEMIGEETSIEKIGAYYLALRWLSHKRLEAKNYLNGYYGNPKEHKTY